MAVIKILKAGETDIDSSDIWRFALHSDYPAQKIYDAGQAIITIPAGQEYGSVAVLHSLGYTPTVIATFEVYGSKYTRVLGQRNVYRPDNEASTYSVKNGTSQILFESIPPIYGAIASSTVQIHVNYLILYEEL